MSVAVISKTGERLMPTSEYRARKLLKSGKAIKHSIIRLPYSLPKGKLEMSSQ